MEEERGADPKAMVVVDLGKKQSRKNVRRLRKGRGKLASKVEDLLADLREAGTLDAQSQAVVVVVREKPRRRGVGMMKKFPRL